MYNESLLPIVHTTCCDLAPHILLREYQMQYIKRGISQRRGYQSKHYSDTESNRCVVIQLLTYHKIGLQTYFLCYGIPLLQYTLSPHDLDTLYVSNAGYGHSLSG
jgi:hypothetical protein